jgi:hypothetical protein
MSRTRNERRRDRKWKWLLGVSSFAALGIIGGIETGGSLWLLVGEGIAIGGVWVSCTALGLYK